MKLKNEPKKANASKTQNVSILLVDSNVASASLDLLAIRLLAASATVTAVRRMLFANLRRIHGRISALVKRDLLETEKKIAAKIVILMDFLMTVNAKCKKQGLK